MAAVLTLGSVAIAADGKTITATISGGTGSGYAITNANGLVPYLAVSDSPYFPIASVGVVGTTLTITLYTPLGSGEAARLSVIAATATLTDSGANTALGQAGITPTNNSTVTVTTISPLTTPDVFELNSGTFAATGNTIYEPSWVTNGDYSVEFVSDCTEAAVFTFSDTTLTASVDGAASSTRPSNGSGAWNYKPLTAAPLTAGKHLFRLKGLSYFGHVRLTGGARTMASVATKKCPMVAVSFTPIGSQNSVTPLVTASGTVDAGTASNGRAGTGALSGALVECVIDGTGLDIAGVNGNGQKWGVSVDRAPAGALVAGGSATSHNIADYAQVAVGLAPGTHTIRAFQPGFQTNGWMAGARVIKGAKTTASSSATDTSVTVNDTTYLAAGDWVRIDQWENRECRQISTIVGLTVTFTAALTLAHAAGVQVTSYSAPQGTIAPWQQVDTTHKRLLAIGDSNTQGANDYGSAGTPDANGVYYATYDPRATGLFMACQALGIEEANVAIQGTTSGQAVGAAANTYGRGAVDYIWIWYGTNDINGNVYTAVQYQANIQAMVDANVAYLRAGGKIILVAPHTPAGVTSAKGLSEATCLTALQAIAAGNPTKIEVWDHLFDNVVTADLNSLHYHPSGHDKLKNNIMAKLAGASSAGFFAAA